MPRVYRGLYRFLLLYALVAGLIGNLAMLPRIGRPWGGFIAQWQQEDWASLIIPGNSPSAPGLQSGALQRGDLIRAVWGADLQSGSLPEAYETLYAAGERSVHYVIERDGETLEADGPLLLFEVTDLLEYRALYVLIALAVWLLGWIVLHASPASSANRAFVLFVVTVVILILPGTFYFNNGRDDVLGIGLTMLTALAFAPLAGAALLRFALAFPTEIGQRWAWLVYVPSLAIIVVQEYAASRIFNSTPALNTAARVATSAGVVYAAIGLAALLLRCLHGLASRRSSTRERHQLSLVLAGFTVGVLLPGLPYAAYLLAAGAYRSASILDRPLIGFLFPALIGYAILRYQTFQGRSRALFTLLMLAIGAVLAQLAGVLLVSVDTRSAIGQNLIIAGVVAISLLTSLFWQSEGRLPRLVNRVLRREEEHYRVLSNLIRASGEATQLPELARRVTEQLAADFEAEYASLWLYERGQGWSLCHSHQAPDAPPLDAPPLAASAVEPLLATSDRVRLAPDPRASAQPGGTEAKASAAIVPLVAAATTSRSILGALVLGPPWTGDVYTERDLQLLAVVAEQVAAALVNAQQMEHLKREPQRILAEVERERERIARELHDTVQQEMGALPYLLESIQAEVGNPAKVQHLFDESYGKLSRVSLELHNLRHDISPPELWSGDQTEALRELMYRKLASRGIACAIEGSLPVGLDRARTTALYRICQQAFDNILQHAGASRVSVAVGAAEGKVCVRIEDDGRGFEVDQLPAFARDGHAGVAGMRERAEALAGAFAISSLPGTGTVVEVCMPARGAE